MRPLDHESASQVEKRARDAIAKRLTPSQRRALQKIIDECGAERIEIHALTRFSLVVYGLIQVSEQRWYQPLLTPRGYGVLLRLNQEGGAK